MCEYKYANIQTGEALDTERVLMLKDNAMLKHSPHLFKEWNFEKNEKLLLDVYEVNKNRCIKAWWICSKCNSNFDMLIRERAVRHSNCPYCSGKRINHTNSLGSLRPDLASQWHPTKNGDISPNEVSCSNRKSIWWYCENCKGVYPQRIDVKYNGAGCSICTGKYVTDVNCLSTTNPKLAALLANPTDGYKYTQSSDQRVDWKCSDCDNILKNKRISVINKQGLKCPKCSDGFSYPEKIVYNVLKKLNLEFSHDITLKFSKNRRYDFYFEFNHEKFIIEVHGKQHYDGSFENIGGKSLDFTIKNDILKERMAKDNGIDHYVIIDARESNIEWIKNSINNSSLMEIFPDLNYLNWEKININSCKSIKVKCLEIYLKGCRDYKLIADELKVDYATVISWLNFWSSAGKCDYKPLDVRKEVVQLTMDYEFVKKWGSVSEARKIYKNVSKVLKNERSNDKKFRFMYIEDYELFLKDKNSYPFYENKIITKEVVQLSLENLFICKWNSLTEASKAVGLKNQSSIGLVCRGLKKTAKRFKWMYLSDYEKLYGEIDK